jgi:MerR family regulatory protein
MSIDQATELLTVGRLASLAGVRPDTIRYYERAGLRTQIQGMLTAMPGPECPDPVPGTWCPAGLQARDRDPEGGDAHVPVL